MLIFVALRWSSWRVFFEDGGALFGRKNALDLWGRVCHAPPET